MTDPAIELWDRLSPENVSNVPVLELGLRVYSFTAPVIADT
jgi:hypothetical protein